MLNNLINRAICKIFNCYDSDTVNDVKHFLDVSDIRTLYENRRLAFLHKKLSYRRETARQLPTWMEGEGLALQPTPPPPSLVIPVHMVESESHNVRTSSVPSVKRTLR